MVTCLSYQCTPNKLMTRENTSWTPFNVQKSKLTMAKQHLLKLGRHIFVQISQPSWVTHLEEKNSQMKYNMKTLMHGKML